MTYRYVTIVLPLAGKGPTMLIFHPVCCMMELPHVDSVRGSLSIALIYTSKSGGFWDLKDDTYAWKSLFLSASLLTDADATGLSLRRLFQYSSHSAFISGVSSAYFSFMNSTFWRFWVRVLRNPFRVVGIPFLIDHDLPFRQIGQCVICLPWLKRLGLGFGLQDTASS